MTKKEFILKCFSEMDIQMLKMLLDDHLLYDGVDKDTFLDRLDELFNEFKLKNDDRLELFKGESNSKNCEYNKATGYALAGNNSKYYTAFIFIETEDDIIGINHCVHFLTYDGQVSLKNQINFISDSESMFLMPIIESLSRKNKKIECKAALDELKKHENYIKNDDAIQWLVDYILLQLITKQSYEENESVLLFNLWYSELKRLVKSVLYEKEVITALVDFKNLEQNNENERFAWLLKYEELYNQVFLSALEGPNFEPINHEYFEPNFKIPEKIKLIEDVDIYIESEPFLKIIEFVIAFAKYYWPTINKLSDETPIIVDDPDFEFSLAYFVKIKNNTK